MLPGPEAEVSYLILLSPFLWKAAEGKFISKRHLYRTAGIDVYSTSAAISPKVRPKWKYILAKNSVQI